MRASGPAFLIAVLLSFSILASGGASSAPTSTSASTDGSGAIRGVVADESGGVLPGVTVVATAADGRVLATGVTDHVGRYAFSDLTTAAVRLTFQLEGFSEAMADVSIAANGDATVPTLRLKLAPKSETVIVRGTSRIAPLPPPRPVTPAPAPPPRPMARPVPDHDRDSVCGPAKPAATREAFGAIRSGRAKSGKALYSTGDEVVIDGGSATGLEIGQNLVARRAFRANADPRGPAGEHTAGLLQIVSVEPQTAVASVVYACDELMPGDWLAAFTPEPLRAPDPPGSPAYDRAAQILMTDDGQLIGAPRRLMVIDRGTDNAFRVGQRLTLFRRSKGGRGPSVVGDAVIVAARVDSATIRVQRASDVIAPGDYAAPQRP